MQDEMIAALADGSLAPELRASVLPHIASCPRCRAAVASVARAVADPAVARELSVSAGGRRWYRIVVPLAAAAVLLLLLVSPGDDRLPGHRGPPPPPPATTPVPRSPVGAVATVHELRWSAVAGADRYRVTVFDATGGVVYAAEASDTVVAFPDSVSLTPGASYLWKVDARTSFDRWAASDLAEFRVAESRRR
ncbi:MAG TPA: zf-HC2 domain-containing protein [Gemmatimonadales bacterium]|nr:zf-HC2 domain-containing protein [Gemmatimonadales bacterium]